MTDLSAVQDQFRVAVENLVLNAAEQVVAVVFVESAREDHRHDVLVLADLLVGEVEHDHRPGVRMNAVILADILAHRKHEIG